MSTFAQLVSQIAELKKKAELQRKQELRSVIKSIKNQIVEYRLTAADLGLLSSSKSLESPLLGASSKKATRVNRPNKKSIKKKVAAKYMDEMGNTWTGRCKQPKWIVSALASGRSLESLLINKD